MEPNFQLSRFAGPLDLLLYLIQKEELDIREVSLVRICDQYVDYVAARDEVDLERVGEFFVMAATLMTIKARSLLPQEEIDLDEELDPEEELIQQLLEYRRVKEASRDLSLRADARRLVHPSRPLVTDAGIPLAEVDVIDLVQAFRKVLAETGLDREPSLALQSERPLSDYIAELLGKLRERPTIPFFQLFLGSRSRLDLIGYFLGLLELIKNDVVQARQEPGFGEITIQAIGEVPDSLTWQAEPVTSESPAKRESEVPERAADDHAADGAAEGSDPSTA